MDKIFIDGDFNDSYESRVRRSKGKKSKQRFIMKTGQELIAEERKRQIDKEGWTPEHDDQHKNGELGRAVGH